MKITIKATRTYHARAHGSTGNKIYRLEYNGFPEEGFRPNYEGTPLESIRRIAEKISVDCGCAIQEEFEKGR